MSRNEITGNIISTGQAKGDKELYDSGWDRIFGKKQQELLDAEPEVRLYGGCLGGGKSWQQNDLLEKLIADLESTPEGKAEMDEVRARVEANRTGVAAGFGDGDGDETSEERIARVKAWLESTREDWLARVERARLSWPDDFEGGVLCGPVED